MSVYNMRFRRLEISECGFTTECECASVLHRNRETRHVRQFGKQATTHDFRLERGLDLPVLNLLPVDPPEEEVPTYVLLSLVAAAQPLGGILRQKLGGEKGTFES